MALTPSGPEWEHLLQHLDLAEGFNLFFLICPSAQHAEAACHSASRHLQSEGRSLEVIPPLHCAEVRLLATRLLLPLPEPPDEVLWVPLTPVDVLSGADALGASREWASALSDGLAGLNQSRNLFAKHQSRPVLLVGTGQLFEICPASAPDLWSIRRSVVHLPLQSIMEPGAGIFEMKGRTSNAATSFERFEVEPVLPPAASLADAERALAAAAKVRGRRGAELDLLRYLIRAGKALMGRGHLAELQAILDEALLVIGCEDLPASALELAPLLNNLARLLQATNRLAEAEPLMRRALEIDERSYGKDHPTVAIRLNNLATLLQDTNRLAEAEPLMRRALEISEKSYGKDHPRVAAGLNNLAQLLQATNRLAEAEPLMRRVLEMDEKSYGKDHPEVATDLNNLALLLQATNRLAEAEPLMRRALEMDEKSYGKDHPTVAIRLNNLARLLHATNRLAEAEPLMRRALEIDEKSYGENHPTVAIRLNNLAALLQATNRLAEAEPLMKRALKIDEKSYGKDHPKVSTDLNNLALLLQDTNRLAEAEPLMRRGLKILVRFMALNGYEHPKFDLARRNYREILLKMKWGEERMKQEFSQIDEEMKQEVEEARRRGK